MTKLFKHWHRKLTRKATEARLRALLVRWYELETSAGATNWVEYKRLLEDTEGALS